MQSKIKSDYDKEFEANIIKNTFLVALISAI